MGRINLDFALNRFFPHPCSFVGTSMSFCFLGKAFGSRLKEIKITQDFYFFLEADSVSYEMLRAGGLQTTATCLLRRSIPAFRSKPHCWPREAVRRGFLTDTLRLPLSCVQSAADLTDVIGKPVARKVKEVQRFLLRVTLSVGMFSSETLFEKTKEDEL